MIRFRFETTDGTLMKLWFPCESRQQYELICYDLDQSTYWKVFYRCDNKKIIRMEQQSWACSIQ